LSHPLPSLAVPTLPVPLPPVAEPDEFDPTASAFTSRLRGDWQRKSKRNNAAWSIHRLIKGGFLIMLAADGVLKKG
jgi:hypothetical protein